MKKIEPDIIKKIVEDAGYLYIPQEYRSANNKGFRVICSIHGEFATSISTLSRYKAGCKEFKPSKRT